ncbi:MAG: protein kinase [Anaerolineae bacterium]|nr:protein kinase [Anaerolineae bacterium]
MSGLSLSLLGSVSAWKDGQPLGSFRTRLALALLIYLACRPERHRREHIMTLLWPGLPQTSAQQNLRQNLYFLRHTVPTVAAIGGDSQVALLLATRETIQLNPDAAVTVDATRLAQLIDLIRPSRDQLKEAATLYRGDFLADFYLPDSNPFEEWASTWREALRRGALVALERLTALTLAEENYPAAEAYARQQLAIDPLHETANRQLIEIMARDGRRSAALHHYDDYRRLLETDLGVLPGSDTLSLVKHVRDGEIEAVGARPGSIRGYEIIEELGHGGFSTVYRAAQPAVRREVAVKVIAARYADDADFIRRFETEAQTIARLEHAHIVPLYDYWREPGGAYLVMRYLRGGNLKTALAGRGWPPERVAPLVDQIAAALHVAHRHGIVHRDVKPANILLDIEGDAYLSDFGIAQLLQRNDEPRNPDIFEGTPDYVAPEQAQGMPVSPLSDQYSLGLVVFEALIGRPPFEADSLHHILNRQLHEQLPSVCAQCPDIPLAVDEVLRQATAKDPADRFPDILAFAHAFRTAVEHGSLPATLQELPPIVGNPYKGLLSFNELDAGHFYGRETLTRQLVARLAGEGQSRRFLAVVGPSGGGKSSLVKAGLVPALRGGAIPGSQKWFIVDMIPGARPFEELEAALLRIAVNPPVSLLEQLQADERGLLRAVRRALPAGEGSELVLLIDQFEELFFLVADREVTARFLNSLYTAVTDPHSQLRVVVTLRADFYDRPLLHPGLSELMQQCTEVIVPLATDELVRAIERPAARMGITVEPELVAVLVADVNEQPGALPLVQYTLSELFEEREGDCLTLSAYRRLGGIGGALERRAEIVYNGLNEELQVITRVLFFRLVTLGDGAEDTRRRVLRDELMAVGIAEQNEIVPPALGAQTVIDAFGAARLLSFDRDPITRQPTVEIAHESLLHAWPRLRGWVDTDRVQLRLSQWLTQAAMEWEAAGRDNDFLLRGARLSQLAPLMEGHVALTGRELEFLQASLAARQEKALAEETQRQNELATAQRLAETEQQRAGEQALAATRLRRRAAYLAGALMVAAALAVVAFFLAQASARNATLATERERQALANAGLASTREAEAVANAKLATSRELSLAAANTLNFDPELSILLALQALETSQTKQAEEQLHQALQQMRLIASFATNTSGQTGPQFALSADGRRLATADTTTLSLWDTQSGKLLRELPLVESSAAHYQMAFDESGERLVIVSATSDRTALTIQTWTLAEVEMVTSTTFPLALDDPAVVVISPDWSLLAVGRGESAVEVWDINAAQRIAELVDFEDIVVDVAFDPTGHLFAAGVRNGQVKLWNTSDLKTDVSPEPIASVAGTAGSSDAGGLVYFSFIDEGSLVLGFLGQVEVWDIAQTGQPRFTLIDNAKLTRAVSVSPDLTRLATAGQDGTTHIWDLADGEHILSLVRHPSPIHAVHFGPGTDRLYTLDRDGLFRVWDARPHVLGEKATLTVDRGVFDIQLNPNETEMALGNAGGPASIWELETGERRFTIAGDAGGVYRVAYDPQGKRVAAVGTDNQIRILDATTGKLLIQFSGHGAGVTAGLFPGTLDVAFSPDGARLATAGADGLAKVWDAATGRELLTFTGHTDSLHSLAWSPDGQLIATSSDEGDTSVILWNPNTGEIVHRLEGHPFRAWGLAFSPDGSMLVTGGSRGVIKAWDVTTGQNLYTVLDESDDIGSVIFTPDGEFFITTGSVPLRIRRASDGEEVLTLAEPLIWSAAISQDGRWLYAADVDGIVRVMAVHLEDAIALAKERLTRWWRPEECQTYLHSDVCPPPPAGF